MTEASLFLDKRVHPRVAVKIPISFKVIEEVPEANNIREMGNKLKFAQTLDTSLGGMYVVTDDHTLKIGDILSLKINLPNHTDPLSAFVDVAWANETGAGLQFLAIKDEDLNSLKVHLEGVSDKA